MENRIVTFHLKEKDALGGSRQGPMQCPCRTGPGPSYGPCTEEIFINHFLMKISTGTETLKENGLPLRVSKLQ